MASATHNYRDRTANIAQVENICAPVKLEDNLWIGINVIIMPGVTIKEGAIIGANAVVTHDVEKYTVMAGVPARKIGNRYDKC